MGKKRRGAVEGGGSRERSESRGPRRSEMKGVHGRKAEGEVEYRWEESVRGTGI